MIPKNSFALIVASIAIFCQIHQVKAQQLMPQISWAVLPPAPVEHKNPQDAAAELVKNFYLTVNGNPYLYNNWLPARITINNGKEYNNILVKYDVWNDVIETKVNDDSVAAVKNVKSLVLYVDHLHPLVFKNGFPVINDYNKNTLYQVLASGTVTFLKKPSKEFSVQYAYYPSTPEKRLSDIHNYFIYKNANMYKLHRSKNAFIKLLPDNQKQMLAYINTNKINLHKDIEFEKVLNYYNTLNQ